jgi:hypothetical protein
LEESGAGVSEKMDYRVAVKELVYKHYDPDANEQEVYHAILALLDKVRRDQAADDAAAINRWADGWEQRIKSGMYQGEILGAADIRRDEGRDLAKHVLALAALGRK